MSQISFTLTFAIKKKKKEQENPTNPHDNLATPTPSFIYSFTHSKVNYLLFKFITHTRLPADLETAGQIELRAQGQPLDF